MLLSFLIWKVGVIVIPSSRESWLLYIYLTGRPEPLSGNCPLAPNMNTAELHHRILAGWRSWRVWESARPQTTQAEVPPLSLLDCLPQGLPPPLLVGTGGGCLCSSF